jgi:hypothetical protein
MRRHLLLPVLALLPATAAAADPVSADYFETKVRPVLAEHCFGCHSAKAEKQKGGLLLDTPAGLLKGGDAGPVIVPGDPGKSRLVAAINYKDVDLQMPPKGKLPDAVIMDLTVWIKMGAPWPNTAATHTTGSPKAFDLQRRKTEHWAWRPVRPTTPPAVQDVAWPLTPVDRYVLARLQASGLRPALPADSETLLRRATFDLTGLPPTPAEIDAYLAYPAPDAFAKAVDRLLASPAFGERWGRHWLDLVRYAETCGHEFDYPVPNAHQYRDYVIRAINADVPYDRFAAEHVAGDLLPHPRQHPADGFDESILGTGFWLFGDMVHSPVDLRQDQADRLDNMIDVFSKTFLGLTVACARCHDHKYDAISTKDYYALMGVIEGASGRQVRFDARDASVAARLAALRRDRRPAVRAALAVGLKPLTERLADALPPAELRAAAGDDRHPFHAWAVLATAKDFTVTRTALRDAARRRAGDLAHALDGATAVVNYAHPGSDDWLPDGVSFGSGPVRAGDLLFAPDADRPVGGIATIAAARFDPAWAHFAEAPGCDLDPGDLHYSRAGRTLRTRSFVVERPKLYSLVRGTGRVFACVNGHTLMEGPLHRKLVKKVGGADGFSWVEHDLSRYRGERVHVELTAGDGDLAVAQVVQADHANVRRLEGEAIRDALLAASGRLDRTLYGPPVPTHLTPFMGGRGRPKESGPLDGAGRRSIYLAVRRNFPEPLLVAFDTPPPATTVGRRTVSNVPAQALILMNDPFVHRQAELWGRRTLAAGGSPAERVAGMVRQAYGRRATDGEVRDCLDFLTGQAALYHAPPDDPRAWADLAHALVNAKEFIFLR